MAGSVPQAGSASSEDRAIQVFADDVRPGESGLDVVRRFLNADSYARHRRARGDDVHFAVGVAVGGGATEDLRPRFESLAISCDWDRAGLGSESAGRALQLLFLALLERDLVYVRDPQPWEGEGRWFLRSGSYAGWCAEGLARLRGTAKAAEAQREALGRVEGAEATATALGLGDLVVFTPFAEAIGEAEFVAVSPRHPSIESIVPAGRLEALARSTARVPAVQTELQAAVPGVEGLLPVVVTPAHEPLALASLGIPSRSETDRAIASQLTRAGGLPVKTRDSGKPRSAVHYKLADLPVSAPGNSRPPVPVIRCGACGVVGVPRDELPLRPGSGEAIPCPSCGGEAARDPEALAPAFEGMWSWLLVGPLGDEPEVGLGDPSPAQPRLAVSSDGDGARLLHQRIATNLFQRLRGVAEEEAEDLTEAVAVVGSLRNEDEASVSGVEELDRLIEEEGADVVRFAILDAAAVGTPTGLYPHSIQHAKRFLGELRDFAEPRLRAGEGDGEVDRSSRLRRRLVAWCGVAREKVAEALDDLEASRVTHNLALLLRRIQDFEQRASEDGELGAEDRQAVAYALSVLVELAAPCVPQLAGELSDARAREAVG